MNKVVIESKLKEYRDNPLMFCKKEFIDELKWYQKLILKMYIFKDRYIKGL